MDEVLFAAEEKPYVEPIAGTSTGNLTFEKPSEVNAVRPNRLRVEERPIIRTSAGARDKKGHILQPHCKACGKTFSRWMEFLKHRDAFRGKPHFFCESCNVVLSARTREDHQKSMAHSLLAKSAKARFESELVPKEEPFEERTTLSHTTYYKKSRIFPFIRISARALEARKKAATESECSTSYNNTDLETAAWERAAGAKKAEDILLGTDCEGNDEEQHPVQPLFLVEEDRKPTPSSWDAPENDEGILREVKKEEVDDSFEMDVAGVSVEMSPSEEQSTSTNGPWMCPIEDCLLGFDLFSSLQTHMLSQHENQPPIWCQLCPMTFGTPSNYVRHMEKTHRVTQFEGNNCGGCGLSFASLSLLWYHSEKFKGLPHYHCEPCNATLREADRRTHQMSKGHRVATNTWNPYPDSAPCCGKTFRWPAHRQRHMDMHKGIPHFYCDSCNLVVNEADSLHHGQSKIHRARMDHPEAAKEHFKETCEDCGKVFYQRVNSERHYDVFKGHPHFYCEPCKLPVMKEEAAKHRRTRRHRVVTGETRVILDRWKCPVGECEASFPYKREFDEHLSAHRTEEETSSYSFNHLLLSFNGAI